MPRDPDYPGIFIINRFNRDDAFACGQLTDILYKYSQLSRKERVENKINARKLADSCDWKDLVSNYIQAHNAALKQGLG